MTVPSFTQWLDRKTRATKQRFGQSHAPPTSRSSQSAFLLAAHALATVGGGDRPNTIPGSPGIAAPDPEPPDDALEEDESLWGLSDLAREPLFFSIARFGRGLARTSDATVRMSLR